jgi:hypothetical protein
MELSCLLSLYLVLYPLGVQSHAMMQAFSGPCNVEHLTVRIEEQGVLHIEHNFLMYDIALPEKVDAMWLTYKLGDEHAYGGNCNPSYHPYDDTFCRTIMTKIKLIGWQ